MNALLSEFDACNTQVLGISVDSKFSHRAWANGFGGINYPLLADFHPKGNVAKAYGLWLDGPGIGDRATVLIDADGVVQWAESAGPGGRRDPKYLLEKCKAL